MYSMLLYQNVMTETMPKNIYYAEVGIANFLLSPLIANP